MRGGEGINARPARILAVCERQKSCYDWLFEKFGSLEVWKFGGLKRRLPWNFAYADFITTLNFQASKLLNFRKRFAFAPAFTMAEILISLTIIGIIAAITLPALQANINEKTWATQRKALYSRMSQAISMMDSLNGYGIGATEQETAQKAAQAFISEGLSKVLKINNICDGSSVASLEKCGFPKKLIRLGTNSKFDVPTTIVGLNNYFNKVGTYVNYSQIDTQAAAFETANGEGVLAFYNPNCGYAYGMNNATVDSFYHKQNLIQPTMCVNFIYDLNGKKGPNKVGKDIGFITAFYPTDSIVVSPFVKGAHHSEDTDMSGLNSACKKKYGDGVRVANFEELKAMFVNKLLLINSGLSTDYVSQTLYINNKYYWVLFYTGGFYEKSVSGSASKYFVCTKQ